MRSGSDGSFSGRRWADPAPACSPQVLGRLCQDLEVSEGLGRLLAARGLEEAGAARRFLHPSEADLHSPSLMRGMPEAVARVLRALEHYEKILICGDYDVDGTSAAAILYNYLRRLGARVFYFIPNRMVDGYGLNLGTVGKIIAWKVELLITVDHGSTAIEAARALAQHGVDLIVTDHHQMGAEAPQTVALVNPHQPGCPYPFKGLSAAGVAFKLICALDDRLSASGFFEQQGLYQIDPAYYLDFVALATVADMSPLVGENRVLVTLGLSTINLRKRPGLVGLLKECNIRHAITPSTISFKIAPKINALGRVGDPATGMQLLLTHSFTEARRLARELLQMNRRRQEIEREVLLSALHQMETAPDDPACILVGGDWHPGVLGSIATRISHEAHKPTVVLTRRGDAHITGSARAYDGYDILQALRSCEKLLERFGGHPTAAGLAMQPGNLGAFTRAFNGAVNENFQAPTAQEAEGLSIEAWLDPEQVSCRFIEEATRLSPFGLGNPEPVVAMRGVRLTRPTVFNHRHLRFDLQAGGGGRLEALAWGHAEWRLSDSECYDIAFVPQLYQSHHGARPQVKVVDMRASRG